MHLDIKSPNILLTESWEAKIADVGLGKRLVGIDSIACEGEFAQFSCRNMAR